MDVFLLRRTIDLLKNEVRGRYETNVSSEFELQFGGFESQLFDDVNGMKKAFRKR